MNALLEHTQSLPALLDSALAPYIAAAHSALSDATCADITGVHLAGCGDSLHAGLCARMWFSRAAGVEVQAHAAMDFSRYAALGQGASSGDLAIGVSVSGGVSRAIEAVLAARRRGMRTLALTSSARTPIAQNADGVLETRVPDLPSAAGVLVPGSRSFYASLLMLCVSAVRLGEGSGVLSARQASDARAELTALPNFVQRAIDDNIEPMRTAARDTIDAPVIVLAGSGPNLGSAHFGAAKIIEACGDPAIATDVEEWAHVQYWMKTPDTPTFLLAAEPGSRAWRGARRAEEVDTAMRAIGRRVIRPALPDCDEALSPFVACIAPLLFAAFRSELLGEPYFRAFGGGRSIEGGGGISRIRTSEIETSGSDA